MFHFFIFCSESQWDMRDIRRTHEHWMSIQKRSWVKLKMKGFLTHAKSINLCTQQKHLTLAATNAFIIWFFISRKNWYLEIMPKLLCQIINFQKNRENFLSFHRNEEVISPGNESSLRFHNWLILEFELFEKYTKFEKKKLT